MEVEDSGGLTVANIDFTLSAEARPAFDALLEVGQAIAATHGEDVAIEWAQGVMSRDVDLFIKTVVKPKRPILKVIAGGLT
ncbi:hypothetical protein [Sphingobium yanoikuyae]|uniref:hypothetical protein n=1 Tax=Sphingobium yanoikuyae TaxID=13690 RepID=UPI0013E04B44|nr:hypothetical protein [Sphingobium yanoikuyae]